MKKILLLTAAVILTLQSCDSPDGLSLNQISEKAQQALSEKYPNAKKIEWNKKKGYEVASFNLTTNIFTASTELNAWFDPSGKWYMTETDLRFDQLPQAVKDAYKSGSYSSWRVEEVDQIERNGAETIFVIEIEKSNKEMDLYYSPDGVLTKELADMDEDYDYEDFIPSGQTSAIQSYISTNYPNASILEIDREGLFTEVEILDNRTTRNLLFDNNSKWISTKTDVRTSDLPAAVMQTIKASDYAEYYIDDADFVQSTTGEYYEIELENGIQDVVMRINADGAIVK